jgi:hypothetical protein
VLTSFPGQLRNEFTTSVTTKGSRDGTGIPNKTTTRRNASTTQNGYCASTVPIHYVTTST